MENLLFTFLLVFAVLFIIFLILRELNSWYWKINKRIELIERQNLLIEKILYHLKGETDTTLENQKSVSTNENITDVLNKLKDNERTEALKFIDYGLKEGDRLVIHKVTRKVDRLSPIEWSKIEKQGLDHEWTLLQKK